MKKLLTCLIIMGLLCLALLLASWLAIRESRISAAREKAQSIITSALKNNPSVSDEEKTLLITKEIFRNFTREYPGNIPEYKLRPYLTNHRLPSFIRLPDGVIEIGLNRGFCDNASRLLSFVLAQENFKSVQWNMVAKNAAHSALLVTLPDGRDILADPYFGYVTTIAPEEAKTKLSKGAAYLDVFKPLGNDKDNLFYHDFQNMSMSRQGDPMLIESTLPSVKKKPLILGTINGDDMDVKDAGIGHDITFYWHYIGHKYNREWTRILHVKEPVTIVMTLVDAPEKEILKAAANPVIDGKTLTWHLKAGESLKFEDGLAGISFKRFNSYIGVDQIVFTYDKR